MEKSLKRILNEIERLKDLVLAELEDLENKGIDSEKKETRDEFDILKELYQNPEWPLAINPSEVTDRESDDDLVKLAETIIDLIVDEPLLDKKVLDFGCNKGYFSKEAIKKGASLSIGYDYKSYESDIEWEIKKENLLLTTDWNKIKEEGPYDIITVIDVIDHLVGENSIDAMKKIYDVLSPNGTAIFRFHPWISRHGSHLFRQSNKAFIHLIFKPNELEQLGLKPEPLGEKVFMPYKQYGDWLTEAGFNLKSKPVSWNDRVELFFRKQILMKRILEHCKVYLNHNDFPSFQMEQSFLTYYTTK